MMTENTSRLRWPAGIFFRLALSAMLAAPLAGCKKQHDDTARRTAVFAIGSEPAGLNRNISSSNSDGLIACIIYQGLVDVRSDGSITPLLAKSWTVSDDGRTYDFQLQHARWSDGKPFTSADVRYTLKEVSAKYSAVFGGAARVIEAIDTPAPDRAVIHLKEPYGPFLLSLGCSQGGAIMPAHIFEGTNVAMNKAIRKPVGTGPFRLERWMPGQYLRLTRNPLYWEPGKPRLDELIATILPQAASRTQALLSHELDFVSFSLLPTNDYDHLRESSAVRLLPAPVASIDVMLTNTRRRELSDPKVRQALMMATDRDYLLRTAYHGIGEAGTMPFTSRLRWAANPAIDYRKMYPYDPARANAMLDAAGLTRDAQGQRMRLTLNYLSDDPDAPLVATAIKTMWARIGVTIDIVPGERVALLPRIFQKRHFDLALVPYNSNGDPALGLSRIFRSSAIGDIFGNASGYTNPQVDQLFVAAQASVDLAERGRQYAHIQSILARDLPVLTLHERLAYSAASSRLHGLDHEYYLPSWRDAWLDP